jgi:hypothetical protein
MFSFPRIFREKSQQEIMIELIEKFLPLLDYEKKLRIVKVPIPINFYVKPSEEGKSRSKNPTMYIINTAKEYNGLCPVETLAVIAAARAVRCRRQSGDNKLEPFSGKVFVSDEFQALAAELDFKCFGPYETDSEIVGRLAGEMCEGGAPIDEIAQMILMSAPDILKKCGVKALENCMYIII